MRTIAALVCLTATAATAYGQSAVRVEGFGFGAAAAVQQGAEPAAQLTAAGLLSVARVRLEVSLGTSVAELKANQGAQRDLFLNALASQSITKYFVIGGGVGLHSLSTRIAGAGTSGPLYDAEQSRSGTRPALLASAALQIPLAANRAAALQLTTRGAFMRGLQLFSFGVNVVLHPSRGDLVLGENVPRPRTARELAGSWDAVVQQVMLLQGQLAPIADVLATRSALLVKFAAPDEQSVRDAIARVARILSGSTESITLTIAAPQPALMAAAATAGGFPTERIRLISDLHNVTLQAIRPPSDLSLGSAQSLPHQ